MYRWWEDDPGVDLRLPRPRSDVTMFTLKYLYAGAIQLDRTLFTANQDKLERQDS